MVRESQRPNLSFNPPSATPVRLTAAEPTPVTFRRSLVLRTPGSQRRLTSNNVATPHARAAIRAIDSRRAAILTPHQRARRRSVRETRDSPRDFLLSLAGVLATKSQRVVTSSSSSARSSRSSRSRGDSSSPGTARVRRRTRGTEDEEDDDEALEASLASIKLRMRRGEDEDDEELPKRPRLSLPIDEEEDDDDEDDLQPHKSVIIDDENNFTITSIEMPRRAVFENNRSSLSSMRMSDYFGGPNAANDGDVGIDSGFFPPAAVLQEGDTTMGGMDSLISPERIDEPSNVGRAGLAGRDSDFGIEIPVGDINESTFVLQAQVAEDSTAQSPGAGDVTGEGGDDQQIGSDGFAPLMDQRSDDYSDEGSGHEDFGPLPDIPEDLDAEEDDDMLVNQQDRSFIHRSRQDETEMSFISAKRAQLAQQPRETLKRTIKVSKYGIEYPSLPPSVVRRIAQTFARASGIKGPIPTDAMKAIMQASDWFFEQLGDDLQAYANHAGRKTIDASDVLTLMKRQRQVNPQTTLFSLAQRHLPRELLQELRMPPPAPSKKRKRAPAKSGGGAADEDVT